MEHLCFIIRAVMKLLAQTNPHTYVQNMGAGLSCVSDGLNVHSHHRPDGREGDCFRNVCVF